MTQTDGIRLTFVVKRKDSKLFEHPDTYRELKVSAAFMFAQRQIKAWLGPCSFSMDCLAERLETSDE
jgi:hypothetical protein